MMITCIFSAISLWPLCLRGGSHEERKDLVGTGRVARITELVEPEKGKEMAGQGGFKEQMFGAPPLEQIIIHR